MVVILLWSKYSRYGEIYQFLKEKNVSHKVKNMNEFIMFCQNY